MQIIRVILNIKNKSDYCVDLFTSENKKIYVCEKKIFISRSQKLHITCLLSIPTIQDIS